MRGFSEYVQTLKTILRNALADVSLFRASDVVDAALDGQPGRELRRLVSLEERRLAGAFFTGSEIAKSIVQEHLADVRPGVTICDPACGAGDLLVAASDLLPVSTNLATTLAIWARQLHGCDIHEEFVEVTKMRLILAAIRRGVKHRPGPKLANLTSLFTHIVRGNGLAANLDEIDVLLMNPPYGACAAPSDCAWATGSVSEAAVFTAELARKVPEKTKIVSILPDVLRTGSRYAKWREFLERDVQIDSVEVIGLFDSWTDVDVFVVGGKRVATRSNATAAAWWPEHSECGRVADFFDVHVGPVVPHRDPHTGPWRRFINARLVPAWQRYDATGAPSRRFDRRTFMPPFVVIRRTSRPDDDRHRAIGTIVTGDKAVAVENHLLVALPHANGIEACHELLEILRADATSAWLNTRIRCRHLTVGAVSDIPWPGR
jgi:hypothetical protein